MGVLLLVAVIIAAVVGSGIGTKIAKDAIKAQIVTTSTAQAGLHRAARAADLAAGTAAQRPGPAGRPGGSYACLGPLALRDWVLGPWRAPLAAAVAWRRA